MENDVSKIEERRGHLICSAKAVLDRAIREGRPLRPAEELDLDGCEQKIGACDRTLSRHSRFNSDDGIMPGAFIRCLVMLARCRGNIDAAIQRAEAQHMGDAVRALSASVATGGGYAIPEAFSAEIIAALVPRVAVRRLGAVSIPLVHGSLRWPRIRSAATVGYLGENSTIQATAPGFGALSFTARRMVALVPISNDLLRYGPGADTAIKGDLVAQVAASEDAAFIRSGGTANSPKGLRYWALPANVITSQTGAGMADVDLGLGALESALTAANVPLVRGGWIFSTRTETYLRNLRGSGGGKAYPEMDQGLLRGRPFVATTSIPNDIDGNTSEVYLADFADCVIAENSLIIDSSTGSYTDSGGHVVSAFSQDQTVVRIVSQHDFGMRHAESVAVLTGVTWGA